MFAIRLKVYALLLPAVIWLASIGFVLWLPQQAVIFCFLAILFAVVLCARVQPSHYQAFLWWCYCSSGIAAIMVLAIWFNQQHISYLHGVMAVFFIAAINDIAQYIVGSIWGRLAIVPSLSPKKTLEGMVGGIIVSGIVSALLLPLLWGITWQWALCLGYSMALSGIVGDLMISLLKRRVGVKHSGSGLPGHGGMLDRLDSMIMIAPVLAVMLITI